MDGYWLSARARTIDPRDYERRLPKLIALLAILVLSLLGWALVWVLCTLVLALWRWAEPALTILAVGLALAVAVIGIGLPE